MYYRGIKFPSWVREPSFVRLIQLTLVGCISCTSLPSLGHLPSLRYLYVRGMDGVKIVGPDFFGTGNTLPAITFPSLEILELSDMIGWERWSTNGNDYNVAFPCLRDLKIDGCPNQVEVSIQSVSSVQVLDVHGCLEGVLRSLVQVASSVKKLKIVNILRLTQLQGRVIESLRAVEELYIRDCKELRYLWESEAEACKILVNLKTVNVKRCPELVCLGEKEEEVNQGNRLTSVREVKFVSCEKLERFRVEDHDREEGIFPCLERLELDSCSGMRWFPTGQKKLPSTLKTLYVFSCENLLMLEPSMLLNSMSSLESIDIYTWPYLKSFPELGRFIHLTRLSIYNCEGIESFPDQGGFLPQGLQYLEISNCEILKTFPDDHLQSLTSLVRMEIYNCPSLDSGFPCGIWPPSLSELAIGRLKKPMSEWGSQNFPTSLVYLTLRDESSVVSFAEAEEETFLLPSSLILLSFWNCDKLESLSKGLQQLTFLKRLIIWGCPKLRDLPDALLPELSRLLIHGCPELKERCSSSSNRRDSYWPLISHIPCVDIL